jgi:hypothetical protein
VYEIFLVWVLGRLDGAYDRWMNGKHGVIVPAGNQLLLSRRAYKNYFLMRKS